MAKDPAFLFYSSDFLSGIADLTMEERGQYITLLCLQHQKGNLTEKTIKISVPNISLDVLSKFTKDKDGNFFNKRLSDEVLKRQEHSKRQRDNVLKRWNKVENTDTNVDTNTIPKQYDGITTVIPLENENENENENIDKTKREIEFEKVSGMFNITFTSIIMNWLDYKRQKGETYKEIGLTTLLNKIKKDYPTWEELQKSVESSISNNYSGLFKPKNNTPQSQYPPLISKNEQRFNKFQEASDGAAAIIRAKYGIEEDS